MEKTDKISVIILDFLKSKRVVENVTNLQEQVCDFEIEIIIVDNSCNEENKKKLETLRRFDNVKLIINEKNLGYTKANNRGAAQATGKYIFIVNPDIVVRDKDCFQKMVDFMDANPDVGIMGPKQFDELVDSVGMTVRAFPKLYVQIARRTFLRNVPLLKQKVAYDEMRHLDYDKTQDVDWLQSSFIVVRGDVWRTIGGLNEKYFLFMSDPEICWRSWELGKRVVFYPEVTVYADGLRVSGGGVRDFFKKWTIRQHLVDSIRYRLRHLGRKNPRLRFIHQHQGRD
ncbi:glycosyl transferase family 2 [Candidatus Peregrinibacteria bacterium HGW-Peregrinibacteria-1]|jgi:GT2 family glycosyltransferase|nr:MAG: glycosyl transferase family 2 [Candidatus Peregrinibacteria bacterium HGW-Peregrinibacteria-1]